MRKTSILAGAFALSFTAIGAARSAADDVVTIRTIGGVEDDIVSTMIYGEDLDEDGAPDLVVETGTGARAFSFKTGAVIRDFTATGHPGYLAGALDFLPDVDGDGLAEILAGAGGVASAQGLPGVVFIFSGKTGAEIRRVAGTSPLQRFGAVLASLGDVTGDGVADFVVGAYGTFGSSPGEVFGFSGADGSAIPHLTRAGTGTDNLGFALAALGDVNQDGVPDFAVGSPGANNPVGPLPARGRVEIVSGKDGRVLRNVKGKGVYFGYALVNAGDVDGDGAADVAAGGSSVPYVSVLSGRTGRTLRKLLRPPVDTGNYFASELGAPTGTDVDGDGRADLATVQYTGEGPIFYVYGTRSFGLVPLDRFQPVPSIFSGRMALVPDQDGDGIADLMVPVVSQGIRIYKVTPDLPPAFTFTASFTRPEDTALLLARGTFTVKVAKGAQTVVVKSAGLIPGQGYGVHLENGVATGEFDQVGELVMTGGTGALTVSATGTPPAELGITSLTQLTGRRVQIRAGDGDVVLETLLPLPGATASSSTKVPLVRATTAFQYAKATGAVSLKYSAKTGSFLFALVVRGVVAGTPLTLEIEDAPGSGVFVEAGPLVRGKFTRDTKRGDELPLGGGTYATIAGRAIRVVSGADVVLAGQLR